MKLLERADAWREEQEAWRSYASRVSEHLRTRYRTSAYYDSIATAWVEVGSGRVVMSRSQALTQVPMWPSEWKGRPADA